MNRSQLALVAARRRRIAQLCELVAEGVSVKHAAAMIGVSMQTATNMMAQVRQELGGQAV